jgi:methylase of polypeptide subunit release factors
MYRQHAPLAFYYELGRGNTFLYLWSRAVLKEKRKKKKRKKHGRKKKEEKLEHSSNHGAYIMGSMQQESQSIHLPRPEAG